MERYKFFSEADQFRLIYKYRHYLDNEDYIASVDKAQLKKLNDFIEKELKSTDKKWVSAEVREGYRETHNHQLRRPITDLSNIAKNLRRDSVLWVKIPNGQYYVTFIKKGATYEERNMRELFRGTKDKCEEYINSVKSEYKDKGELDLWPSYELTPMLDIKVKKR